MRVITFDIESISNSNVRGHVDVNEQELIVVAVHDSETGEYTSYEKEDLPKLWPLIEKADVLVGFNSNSFDIPLLNRYYPGDLLQVPSLDLLVEVQKVLGRRIRLQSLAEATLGTGKSGDGLQAGVWWREGKKDMVHKYCIDDVRITRTLYDYAREHGKLRYKDLNEKRDIKLDASDWETPRTDEMPALTHALPL